MSFNSFAYVLFLAAAVTAYYVLPGKICRVVLLLASGFFYYCWGWQYPALLACGTLMSFFCARRISACRNNGSTLKKQRLVLAGSLVLNLSLLFFFKYFNFFGSVINSVFSVSVPSSSWILSVGISFWSFQACSYLIDVYRGKLEPEKSLLDYALYMFFFPRLIQGPIERAGELLPQLKEKNKFDFDNIAAGLTLFITGLVRKMIIADNLAPVVNTVFSSPGDYSGLQMVFASFCYTIQIYMDFCGYTDMAKGSAMLFGIRLRENFNRPYFAVGVQDFWRRWHISLTSWFRDYLYFPLGGSRVSRARHLLNILIVFAVSGLWHGAAVNFIVWGLLHGLYQVFEILLRPLTEKLKALFGRRERLFNFFRGIFTFLLVNYAWIFFRVNTVSDAVLITKRMILIPFNPISLSELGGLGVTKATLLVTFIFMLAAFAIEAFGEKLRLRERLNASIRPRYAVYTALILAVLIFGYYGAGYNPIDFIYFKF